MNSQETKRTRRIRQVSGSARGYKRDRRQQMLDAQSLSCRRYSVRVGRRCSLRSTLFSLCVPDRKQVIMKTLQWFHYVAVLCSLISVLCQPEGPPLRLRRDSPTTATSPIPKESTAAPTTASLLESRQGRIGPTQTRLVPTRPPVHSHRSNVNYANNNPAISRPQGPPSVNRISPPSPPVDDGPLPPAIPIEVTDIRCMQTTSRELFTAVISTPNSLSSAPPVFEDRPLIEPSTSTTCQISPADRSGRFRMSLSNLDYCGVTTCPQDGQPWLCLTLRFPALAGLKLPEDEIVVVRCRPQDRTIQENKDIDFSGAENMRVEPKAPVMFTGGRQEFQCEIGLFRKLPGTSKLQQVHSGVAVELGEEVQLKSVVRSNDGWYHSKMTDVVVRRLKQQANSVSDGSAMLVLPDGCRNPAYKAIAPHHPERDGSNSLLNNFNFRVFLFQDMEDGDSILISAKVIACVEAIDCAPSLCADSRSHGFGRRRRGLGSNETDADPEVTRAPPADGKTREILIQQILYPNGTQVPVPANHQLKGWETDLALRVAMPGEFYSGNRHTPLGAIDSHCFLYLMLTVAMATALGVTTILMSIYCICKCHKGKDASNSRPAAISAPVAPSVSSQLETLMEACYPELQVLDALSRSVRLKKQQMHLDPMNLQESFDNVYSCEPTSRPEHQKTLRQMKRGRPVPVTQPPTPANRRPNVTTVTLGPARAQEEDHYWEIGPSAPQQIFPPTKV